MIDTHCHLNDASVEDPKAEVEAAREAGVDRLVVIGVDLQDAEKALAIAERHEGVYAAMGFHPNHTADYKRADLKPLAELLKHPKTVGLGEIGLDFYHKSATRDEQERALLDQLDLALDLDLPVIFHCREAHPELLEILEKRERRSRYLFHCFGGNAQDAARAFALGALFGVDGPVTYKSAQDLRETLETIPLGNLVLETDSPYLPPVPYRGKPNRPAYIPFINEALARLKDVSAEECAAATTRNAEGFFRFTGTP